MGRRDVRDVWDVWDVWEVRCWLWVNNREVWRCMRNVCFKNSRKTDKKGQWDKINMVFGAYTTGFLERSVVFNQEGYTASSSDASSESDEEEPSPLCAPPLYEPVDADCLGMSESLTKALVSSCKWTVMLGSSNVLRDVEMLFM